MQKQQTGMILAIVLIFLLILSLLAVSALSTSHLQMRMSQNFGDDVRLLQAAEVGLRAAEKKLIVGSYKLDFDGITVNYAIEPLTTDASCVFDDNHSKHSGVYYRITSQAGWNAKDLMTLEITYAQATAQKCANDKTAVQLGRLSWRQI